jgi:hypothetical protein
MKTCITLVLALALPSTALASSITTRANLQAILGGPGTLETFETFVPPAGSFAFVTCNPIDSAAVCNGQGPGLVVPGLSITGNPAWQDAGYFGLPSRTLGDNIDAANTQFRFTVPVTAFGADLFAYAGFASADATVTIFAPNFTTVIGQITGITLLTTGTFAGWQDAAGIGAFSLAYNGTLPGYIPNTDNVEFGTAATTVPEPATLFMLGAGLVGVVRRQRSARRQ